jgi:phage terminase large subunit
MALYIETTALKKIISLTKRIRFVSGGTSSSKTISILMWLIDYCQSNKGKTVSVVSETRPHLVKGAVRDFRSIMESHGYFKDDNWNKTELTYMFETGTRLGFFSADQPSKARGPRRNVLYLNEANTIPFEVYNQLEVRTKDVIWIDSNPTHEYWAYTEVKAKREIDFITLTYKDNEGLSKEIIESIESRKNNRNWYRVYGLGELGEAEHRIYKGWVMVDEIPHEAKLVRHGLDFGYTNDPSAIVSIYYYNGGYILDEIIYQKGLSNKDLADILNLQGKATCVADSAEPKSIDEIKSYGVIVLPATKGAGSVNQGIQYIQEQKISVTKRSTNLWKEYNNYLWVTDRDGKILNVPQDFLNHMMDGVRYGFDKLNPNNNVPTYIPQNNFNQWTLS